jgi:hypothetical protein
MSETRTLRNATATLFFASVMTGDSVVALTCVPMGDGSVWTPLGSCNGDTESECMEDCDDLQWHHEEDCTDLCFNECGASWEHLVGWTPGESCDYDWPPYEGRLWCICS